MIKKVVSKLLFAIKKTTINDSKPKKLQYF